MLYSTALSGLKINPEDRSPYLHQLCFPDLRTLTGSGMFPYNPDVGGKLWFVLSCAAGENFARFDLSAKRIEDPAWRLQE